MTTPPARADGNPLSALYTGENNTYGFRVMEAGPIGRRMFLNSRLSVNWVDQTVEAAVERPTIVVLDSMTFGGAQQAGGTHSRNYVLESDLDYVRGIHSLRAGIKVTATGTFRDGPALQLSRHVHLQQPGGVPRRNANALHHRDG